MRFVQYTQFLSRPLTVRWLYPKGFWEGEDVRQLYGKIINGSKKDHVAWFPFQVIVSIIAALLSALPIPCEVMLGLLAALFAASACVMAWKRPQRSRGSAFLCVAIYGALSLVCLSMDLLYAVPSPGTYRLKDAATIVLVVLILVRCVYDLVLWYREERTWHHFRGFLLGGSGSDTSELRLRACDDM